MGRKKSVSSVVPPSEHTDAPVAIEVDGGVEHQIIAVEKSENENEKAPVPATDDGQDKTAASLKASSKTSFENKSLGDVSADAAPKTSYSSFKEAYYEIDEFEEESDIEETVSKTKSKPIKDDPDTVCLETESQVLRLTKLPSLLPDGSFMFSLGSFSSDLDSVLFDDDKGDEDEVDGRGSAFFEKLGTVPSVDNVSLSIEAKQPNLKAAAVRGHFVNPLTGSIIFDDEIQSVPLGEEEALVSEDLEEEEDVTEEFSFKDFDAILDAEEIVAAPKKQEQEEDLLEVLIAKSNLEGKVDFNLKDEEARKENERLRKALVDQVHRFLGDLLKAVVNVVEAEASANIFRTCFDKRKLFEALSCIVADVGAERYINGFLVKKSTEFYRRKRNLQLITPEKPDQQILEQEKYKESLERLDKDLGKEAYIERKTTLQINDLEDQESEVATKAENETAEFESFVYNTLKRDGKFYLEQIIKMELHKMTELNHEIREVRMTLLQRQHTLGTIKANIDELENMGDNLRVADYEALQRQATMVGKKIEERNRDLNKLYDRFHSSLHILAHSKLKNYLYIKRITEQASNLQKVVVKKTECRQIVFELKTRRQKIKRQVNELRIQSGLLDNPELLLDYDETNERVNKKRKVVEDLRLSLKKQEQKLKYLEKACEEQ